MPPVLGNLIAIAAVAALVFVCARYQWKELKQGGCSGCSGCGGCSGGCGRCGGGCAGCGYRGNIPHGNVFPFNRKS